jgi:hypothetical protein
MATYEEIVHQLDALTPESLGELARFVHYLQWKQTYGGAAVPMPTAGKPWAFDFVENLRQAIISADQDPAGMEVKVGEAVCGGVSHPALWQHPPVQGSAVVEYRVPVPTHIQNLRLRFATGIRDGAELAEGNVVAFRVFVNNWRMWSDTQQQQTWKEREFAMPAVAGDIVRVQFVTDGLGNHEWAWATWGDPRLVGEVAESA